MRQTTTRLFAAVAFAGALVAANEQSNAAVVTFEELANTGSPLTTSITSAGYIFSPSAGGWNAINSNASGLAPDFLGSSTKYLAYLASSTTSETLSAFGGGVFNLNSLDVGAWVSVLPGASNEITLTANYHAGGTFSQNVTLTGLSFNTFSFAKFTNLDSVTLGGYPDFSIGVAIDNINVTVVPEPETIAMLLAGLGVLGFVARRRRA